MNNPFGWGSRGQTPDMSAYNLGQSDNAAAAPVAGDERVRLALEATQWPYEVSPAHNFRVVAQYAAEGRSQLVFIASATGTYRGREWRKVWSEAFHVAGQLSAEQARELLQDNDRHVFGAWYSEERDGATHLYFQVAVPADAAPDQLEEAIYLVAEVADNKELATVGTDAN